MQSAEQLVENYKEVRRRLLRPIAPIVSPAKFNFRRIYDAPIGPSIPQWELDRRAVLAGKLERDKAALAMAVAPMVQPSSPFMARRIVHEVCEKHGVSKTDICSERRAQKIVLARMEACYRLRKETTWSLPRIGQLLGGRDHTTVLHSVRKHAAINGLPL